MMKVKTVISYPWRHKKRSLFVIILISVLLFVLSPKKSTEIETQAVKRQNVVQSVTASGSIVSETSVSLNFLAGGKLVYVGAKKGEMVKKYQTIAQLDQRTLQYNIEDAVKTHQNQEISYDRVYEKHGFRTLEDTGLSVDARRDLETAINTLDQKQIALAIQKIARESSVLSSPIAGVVTRADVTTQGVNVSATTTYTIEDPNNVLFRIEVDESDIGKVQLGQLVKITLESFPDDPINLTVTDIDFTSHESENGANVFNVEATFSDNINYIYRIGMKGDAEIILAEKKGVLTAPLGSITEDGYVYVKKEKTFEKRKVVLGIQSDTDVEVTGGLREGEELALVPDEVEKTLEKKKKSLPF